MKDELFLNNKVVTGLINSIESNGADLLFDETPLTIQSKAIGTDCMMKLANDSAKIIELTKDYRSFVCNSLVPSMRGVQRNLNGGAVSVSKSVGTKGSTKGTKTTTRSGRIVYEKNTITLLIFGLVLGLVSLKIILTANVPEEKTNEVTSDSSSVKKYLGSKTECTIDEYVEFNSYLDEHYKDVAVYGYVTDIEDEFNMTVSNKETNGDYEIHVYSSYNIDMLEIGQKVFLTGDMYRCNGIDEKEYMYGIKLDSYTNQYLSTGDDSIDYIDVNTFYDKCVLLYEKTSFVISGELIRNTIYGQVCYYLVATNQEEETTAKLRVVFQTKTDIEQYLNSEIQIEADYCKGVEGTWVTNAVIL